MPYLNGSATAKWLPSATRPNAIGTRMRLVRGENRSHGTRTMTAPTTIAVKPTATTPGRK
jgi:hypothetical protein